MRAKNPPGLTHLLLRAWKDEWQHAQSFRQVEYGLRLPSKQMGVHITLILVTGNVAQIGKMERLTMDHGIRPNFPGGHLICRNGKMRVEFARHAFEAAACGGENFSEGSHIHTEIFPAAPSAAPI
jgi:hypothetical protein